MAEPSTVTGIAPDLDNLTDLRRRDHRDFADALLHAAEWADPADRALIEAVYREGLSAKDVARLRDEQPRAIRRRLRVLIARLLSKRFGFVLRERHAWPPTQRRVATVYFLQGRSLRETSTQLNLSLHAVRRAIDATNALYSTLEQPQKACA